MLKCIFDPPLKRCAGKLATPTRFEAGQVHPVPYRLVLNSTDFCGFRVKVNRLHIALSRPVLSGANRVPILPPLHRLIVALNVTPIATMIRRRPDCESTANVNRITAARAELSEALRILGMVPPNCRQHFAPAIEHIDNANTLLGEAIKEDSRP
jgi:hypothetical protein